LAVRLEPIQPESSILAATNELRDYGVSVLPVADNDRLVGVVGEKQLMKALQDGLDPKSPVSLIMEPAQGVVSPYASGAEAMRQLNESDADTLIVVDDAQRPVGVLAPSSLFAQEQSTYSSRPVGGMATPFGVYLTNGVVSGGAGPHALFLTGMLMFGLFWLSATVVGGAFYFGVDLWTGLSSEETVEVLKGVLSVAGFLGLLRLIPLAGTHAAEHQTVHAIERGEPLHPEIVQRMPRVHPRCGTNLAAGLMIFFGLFGANWTPYFELNFLMAAFAAILLWKPVGGFLQKFVTTKPANRRQIESGIRAGRELLQKHDAAPFSKPNVLRRLAKSGIFHIMLGAIILQLVVWALGVILQVPMGLRVL
jgi:hypothetical protein